MSGLMRRMLETRGIYMAPAGDEGAAGGGGPAADAGAAGKGEQAAAGQENGTDGGHGDRGNGDEGGEGDAAAAAAALAAKAGDGNKPTDREAQLLKETMKWKEKFRTLELTHADIQTQYDGIDPVTARKLADDAKERERTDLEKKGEYDRIVQQMRTENAKLIETKVGELTTTQQALQAALSQVESLTVGEQFRKSEFISKSSALPATIAQKEFGTYFEFENGQMVPYDKPRGAAERTVMVDANGTPKTFEQAIAELHMAHPDHKSLVRTTLKAGAASKSEIGLNPAEKGVTQVRGLGKIEQGLNALTKANQ